MDCILQKMAKILKICKMLRDHNVEWLRQHLQRGVVIRVIRTTEILKNAMTTTLRVTAIE